VALSWVPLEESRSRRIHLPDAGRRRGLDAEVLGGDSGVLDRDGVAADHAADSDGGSGSEF
jgi:hypothetical protein